MIETKYQFFREHLQLNAPSECHSAQIVSENVYTIYISSMVFTGHIDRACSGWMDGNEKRGKRIQ